MKLKGGLGHLITSSEIFFYALEKFNLLGHILVLRTLLDYFRGSEVHNELLCHDESNIQAPKQ